MAPAKRRESRRLCSVPGLGNYDASHRDGSRLRFGFFLATRRIFHRPPTNLRRSMCGTMGNYDDQLMRLIAGDDSAAFERLVRRWERPVVRVLTKLVVPASEHDDLAQEVFLRVFRSRQKYRADGQFKAWLYRIVLNVARDAGRKTKRNRTLSLPAEPELPGRTDDSPDFEVRHELRRGLSELLPAVREAIVLKHFAELTFQQISTLTGTPVSTVKSRVHQGLRELRTYMIKRGLKPQELMP